MTQKLDTLEAALTTALGAKLHQLVRALGEITVTVHASVYADAARILRDDASLRFEQLVDLCGLDFSDYKNQP